MSTIKTQLTIFFVLLAVATSAQVGNVLLHEQVEANLLDSILADPTFHTGLRPYRIDQIKGYNTKMKALGIHVDTRRWHRLFNTDVLNIYPWNKKISIRPIFSTELGPIFTKAFNYENDRKQTVQEVQVGARVRADLSPKLSIDASLLFMNWAAPVFHRPWIDSTHVVPRVGEYSNGDDISYGITEFMGNISYSPSKSINIQLGRGKNFFGDGYRSLMLSDHAPVYNYAKLSVDVWKLKYVFLLAGLKDINPLTSTQYTPKYSAMHYLSYNVTQWLNLNFFEAIIQQQTDSVGYRGLDVNYLNPFAFLRPVEFNIGSPDNALIGFGGKLRFSPHFQLYGSMLIDEFILSEMQADRGFWGNKYGTQVGLKVHEPFRFKGFYFQAEYNRVQPYTYSHGYARESYGHLHTPLAHPLGANFSETLAIIRYTRKRFGFSIKLMGAQKGLDIEDKNFGGDIYKDYETRTVPEETKIEVPNWEGENDFGHTHLQGLLTKYAYREYKVYYIINHRLNIALEAGITFYSKQNTDEDLNYTYGFFGIRTYLFNRFLDYPR